MRAASSNNNTHTKESKTRRGNSPENIGYLVCLNLYIPEKSNLFKKQNGGMLFVSFCRQLQYAFRYEKVYGRLFDYQANIGLYFNQILSWL